MKNQKRNLPARKTQHHKKPTHKTSNFAANSAGSHDFIWICGKHPAFAAILSKKRRVFEILVSGNSLPDLEAFLQKNQLSNLRSITKIVEKEQIDRLFTQDQTHQGISVRCSKLAVKNQNDLLSELYEFSPEEKLPTLLLLDQISDPHNAGAIIRSAAAFGVKYVIFCEHNSVKENATIVKSSAGTIDLVDLVVVTNFNNLMEKLKKIGYWCVGLAGEGKTSLKQVSEYKNIALIVGSEGSGLRDLVKKNCDLLTRIDIDSQVESLNASVATAIALYELAKN